MLCLRDTASQWLKRWGRTGPKHFGVVRNSTAPNTTRWRSNGNNCVCVRDLLKPVKGTWCSGITSSSHAEGPRLNPQCVHTTCDFLLSGCSLACMLELFRKFNRRWIMTPARLEPAIPDSVGRCLIHWTTGPSIVAEERTSPLRLVLVEPNPRRWELMASARVDSNSGRSCKSQMS